MHFTKLAVLLALPLLALASTSARAEAPEEEEVEVEAPAVAVAPEYFDLRLHDGQAFVAVPILAEESDAWSEAAPGKAPPSTGHAQHSLTPADLAPARRDPQQRKEARSNPPT